MIDLQQTDHIASRHWPFTAEFNAKGIIEGPEVVQAIEDSGADEILLSFELRSPAFHPQEYDHIQILSDSVNYWRQWVQQ